MVAGYVSTAATRVADFVVSLVLFCGFYACLRCVVLCCFVAFVRRASPTAPAMLEQDFCLVLFFCLSRLGAPRYCNMLLCRLVVLPVSPVAPCVLWLVTLFDTLLYVSVFREKCWRGGKHFLRTGCSTRTSPFSFPSQVPNALQSSGDCAAPSSCCFQYLVGLWEKNYMIRHTSKLDGFTYPWFREFGIPLHWRFDPFGACLWCLCAVGGSGDVHLVGFNVLVHRVMHRTAMGTERGDWCFTCLCTCCFVFLFGGRRFIAAVVFCARGRTGARAMASPQCFIGGVCVFFLCIDRATAVTD